MWCDNCCLLLPLRAGAIAWGIIIFLYSVAGGIFLFKFGEFLYFVYPEWLVYGGIAIFVGVVALINIIALANRSYTFVRVCKFLWPFTVVVSAIRAVLMIVELSRGKDKIQWECDNGGYLYGATTDQYVGGVIPSFDTGICQYGVQSLYNALVVSVLVDLGFQIYMLFLNSRYAHQLEEYTGLKGPRLGGYYDA